MKHFLLFTILSLVFIVSCSSQNAGRSGDRAECVEVDVREGTNMSAAVSPQNNMIALDLQGIIWTMPVGGGRATAITGALGDCHEPAWSPDGTRLAFHCYRNGYFKLWISDADGHNLQQVTRGPHDDREPTWARNGSELVFSSDRSGNYDIWRVHIESKAVEQITSHGSADHHPAVSGDDGRIAFVSDRERSGIFVLEKGRPVRTASSSDRLVAPSWQPGGDHLVFVEYTRETSRMYRTSIDDSRAEEVIGAGTDIFPFRVSWISDSTFVYTVDGQIKRQTLGDGDPEVIPFRARLPVERPDYERKRYTFDDRAAQEVKGITGPVVSPDGERIAFSALGDIYIKEIGGETRKLTDDEHVDIDPDWSPDGTKLAFASDRGDGMSIWIRDVSSRQTRLLTDEVGEEIVAPAWSSDGTRIAFQTIGHRNVWGSSVLYAADVSTGEVTALHEAVFAPSKPNWSPDDRHIAMMALEGSSSRYREGLNRFLIVPVDSGSVRYVAPDSGRILGMRVDNGPIWSPDGRKMAYVQDGALWTVPVRDDGSIDGAPTQRTSELSAKISWTGDSQQIVFLGTDELRKLDLETGTVKSIPVDLTWQRLIPDREYIVHAGRLFTGVDSTYLHDIDVVVRKNRIAEVRSHGKHPPGRQVVDASEQVVMPGLFDMHTHLHKAAGKKLGRLFLSYGITSVRETGADPYDARGRKEAWSSAQRPGPREFFTGGLMDGNRVYYGLANGVIHIRHLEQELERAGHLGYDLIKTYVRMSDAMQKKVIARAHAMGIPVSSHEIYPAARFGVDAVEHLRGTSRDGYSTKLSNLNYMYEDAVQIIAQARMSVTPTIVMHGGFLRMALQYPGLLDHPQINACYADSYVQGYRDRMSRFQETSERPGRNFQHLQAAVRDIADAGGTVTAGTDVPFLPFGSSLHAELWLYVDGGLTPFQALQTATVNAAKAAGVANDLGSIETGKLADLVIVDGDPLHSINETLAVKHVIRNGVLYPVEDLIAGCQ